MEPLLERLRMTAMKVVVVPTRWDLHICIYAGTLSLLAGLYVWRVLQHGGISLVTAVIVALVCAALLAWCVRSAILLGRAYARQQRELQRDPSLLGCKERCASGWGHDKLVYQRLADSGTQTNDATLVIFGLAPFIPRPTDYAHEPEVSQSCRPNVATMVLLAFMPVALWLQDAFGLGSPGAYVVRIVLLSLTGLLLLVLLAQWLMASRKYLRISPGLVEIIRMPLWWGTPTIRSYPCAEGTAMILRLAAPSSDECRHGLMFGITPQLSVKRGLQHDRTKLVGVDLEVVLRMLTSTRKTPPTLMPRDALTG